MSTHLNPLTGKYIDTLDSNVFYVYTRRSNCPRRLIHTSKSIVNALEAFNLFKVFQGDYKYLEGNKGQILRETSIAVRESYRGMKITPNYERKKVHLQNTPKELVDKFNELCEDVIYNTDKTPAASKVLTCLMIYFCKLTQEERNATVENNHHDILKYQMLSGGDNMPAIKKYLNNTVEDDLL